MALSELGIPFTIIEKNESVGGTWLTNVYPGAGVDTPSHLYSAVSTPADWKHFFAKRDEIHAYMESMADRYEIRQHVQFGTEVVAATYDEKGQRWRTLVRRSGDTEETITAQYLITAVGGFARPVIPDIPGIEGFSGVVAHTARWPKDLDVANKRIVVVGTGASGIQLVPALAAENADVTVIQRTAQWIAPFEKFNKLVPDDLRLLMEAVPFYRSWYRLRLLWSFSDKIHASLQKDPDWPHQDRAINEINDGHRRFFTRYMNDKLAGRPDVIEQVTPTYPPFGKRILLDNGWYESLLKPNVRIVTSAIREFDEKGPVLENGEHIEADIVVVATGFDVVRFLAPMRVFGREGRELRDEWDDDDARAYLGMSVPGFPNFFTIYGPNTQGAGGSFIFIAECQVRYLKDLLQKVRAENVGSVEPRRDVFDSYNERVDIANERMIFTHPGMETYYRNARGRVVVVNPFPVVEFWHMTQEADLSEYALEPAQQGRGTPGHSPSDPVGSISGGSSAQA
jgi:4-hydroxyacetophenone monooxygenase